MLSLNYVCKSCSKYGYFVDVEICAQLVHDNHQSLTTVFILIVIWKVSGVFLDDATILLTYRSINRAILDQLDQY